MRRGARGLAFSAFPAGRDEMVLSQARITAEMVRESNIFWVGFIMTKSSCYVPSLLGMMDD